LPCYGRTTQQRILAQLDQPPAAGHTTGTGAFLARALGDVSKHEVCAYCATTRSTCDDGALGAFRPDAEFVGKAVGIGGYLDPT